MEYETPQKLYHYCSLSTFYNIVKNKSIWVSDVQKSNDFLEVIWLKQLFTKQMNDELYKFQLKLVNDLNIDQIDDFLNIYQKANEAARIAFLKTWVFCLSEEKDLLSQWRGYADDGKGISIGFNGEFLDGICSLYTSPSKDPKATIFFDKVHYDKNIANDYINETGISNVEKCQTIDELKQCVFGAMAKLEKESPYFKNSSFAEEKEWRIVITYVMDHFSGADLSGLNTDDYNFGKLDYIVSNNKLVSHFEIKFPNIKNAISEIVIGPKCTESIVDIKHFLISLGILENMDDKSIKIIKSQASYR